MNMHNPLLAAKRREAASSVGAMPTGIAPSLLPGLARVSPQAARASSLKEPPCPWGALRGAPDEQGR